MDSLSLALSLPPVYRLAPKPSLSFTLSPFFKSTICANPLQHPLCPFGAAARRSAVVWYRKDIWYRKDRHASSPPKDCHASSPPATATYDIDFYSDLIDTTVTNDPDVVTQWIADTVSTHSPFLTIGLDIEWLPNRKGQKDNPVATLQLCIDRRCLIFQLILAPVIPVALAGFLANPNHIFVGVGVADDVEKLKKDYGFGLGTKTVDLRDLAVEKYRQPELKRAGLKRLAKTVLDKDMEKDQIVTCSDVADGMRSCWSRFR
ncbi:hypothetical protein CASFOL_009003 [Castilleja foliolosa]|uniref:3'-5' exonuclease domain-containing protein n=1 Tax=Castilleja foliolosa TaxID=1961234 RepID=A0ABD3E0K9_9LAMI